MKKICTTIIIAIFVLSISIFGIACQTETAAPEDTDASVDETTEDAIEEEADVEDEATDEEAADDATEEDATEKK